MLMQLGSRLLERTTPAGLVLAGAALALSMPPVRKSIRSAAVMATRGVLMASDTIRHVGSTIREELEDIVAEAREGDCPACETMEARQRRIANAASQGLMTVSHKARSLSEKVGRYANDNDHIKPTKEYDGLEADEADS